MFRICEGLDCVVGKTKCAVCAVAKRNFKNAKGQLFLAFLSTVPIPKHGQPESLAASSIWSLC